MLRGPRSWLQLALLFSMFAGCGWCGLCTRPIGEEESRSASLYVLAKRGLHEEDAPALEITLAKLHIRGDDPTPHIRVERSSSPRETIKSFSVEVSPMRRDLKSKDHCPAPNS